MNMMMQRIMPKGSPKGSGRLTRHFVFPTPETFGSDFSNGWKMILPKLVSFIVNRAKSRLVPRAVLLWKRIPELIRCIAAAVIRKKVQQMEALLNRYVAGEPCAPHAKRHFVGLCASGQFEYAFGKVDGYRVQSVFDLVALRRFQMLFEVGKIIGVQPHG